MPDFIIDLVIECHSIVKLSLILFQAINDIWIDKITQVQVC